MNDPNRNGGILNVFPPFSDQVPFHVETQIVILNPQLLGTNNSPILLQPPIDIGFVDQPFLHNPNAWDSEGDSLSYELIVPLQAPGVAVPSYLFPYQIVSGVNNTISMDPLTGDFAWTNPQKAGEYNVAFRINEYRNGIRIGTVIRDMQITIREDMNQPPTLTDVDEICVIAGDTIQFVIEANDPDSGQLVKLTASGGPLLLRGDSAIFTVPSGFRTPPVQGTFTWATTCEHIRDQYYQLVFKAEDNFLDSSGFSTLKSVRIKVVGPPPEDLQIDVDENIIDLDWEFPYACESWNRFAGFAIWRKEGSNPFPLDTCDPGIAGKGYTLLRERHTTLTGARYTFSDSNVVRGKTYCYRIEAQFELVNTIGRPYRVIPSLSSEEVCAQLSKDIPLMTHADVDVTDPGTGIINVGWSKPDADDLDTLQNAGPYTYNLYRSIGFTGGVPLKIASFTSLTFAGANDTTFIDMGLNTEDWGNFTYTIYRFNSLTSVFDSIGVSTTQAYTDRMLINGETYCYYIRARGGYGIANIQFPLLNRSQQTCAIPVDTIPPCPPDIFVSNQCQIAQLSTTADELTNKITWDFGNRACADDAVLVRIFFSPSSTGMFSQVGEVPASDTAFFHRPQNDLTGCYSVLAIDTAGNVGNVGSVVCIGNCPVYVLPNTFTPNDDGSNDNFIPINQRYIETVDFKVFNRWGNLLYETTDPNLGWDGTNTNQSDVAEGVYFYTCKITEYGVGNQIEDGELLKGWITLIRGK